MDRFPVVVLLVLISFPHLASAGNQQKKASPIPKSSTDLTSEEQLARNFFSQPGLQFKQNPIGVRFSLTIPANQSTQAKPVCAILKSQDLQTLRLPNAHLMYRASDSIQRMKPLFQFNSAEDSVCIDPSSNSTSGTDQNKAFWILVVASNCVAQQSATGFGLDDSGEPCSYQPVVLYLYANLIESPKKASSTSPSSGNYHPTASVSPKPENKFGPNPEASPDDQQTSNTSVPSSSSSTAGPSSTTSTIQELSLKAALVWIGGDPWVSQSWLMDNTVTPTAPATGVVQGGRFQLVIDGRNIYAESTNDGALLVDLQPCQKSLEVELYLRSQSCRTYVPDGFVASVPVALVPRPGDEDRCPREQELALDNGITVGKAKVYDTFALRKLLTATATQLASIVPFNPTTITNAYGTLQGVQRDASYVAAQVSTIAGSNTTSNLSAPGTTTQTTTPITGPSTVSQAVQCPTNFVPSYTQGSTSSTWTCVAANGNTAPATITTTTTPASGASTVTNSSNPSQTTQTVMNGVAGVVPTAPASTALAAPTTTSVSASDMLTEQVELSAQLSMLQMLLKGADSDQLLVSNGRAVGMRKQTTLSFPITLRPPQAFKRAVAEVRVLMIPRKVAGLPNANMDIVNLLPSEKTYNVAKITSKQKSFGAGVVIEAVSLGIAVGKSRDRLYIAKDTDTVALQYPTTKLEGILAPWPSRLGPAVHNFVMRKSGELDTDESCTSLPPHEVFQNGNVASGKLDTARYDFPDAVMFGWQFRPVLGADYVASNVRNVFAQIALPTEESSQSAPLLDVFVQTRWRQYSPNAQVTGPSYSTTCQWKIIENSITIDNPIKVKDVTVTDTGGGILRFRAQGDLLSSSFIVRNGSAFIPPTFFDGRQIEFFENAADVLHGGDIELVGEDGSETPVVIPTESQEACSITDSELTAIPRPDGSAVVLASVTRGDRYLAEPTVASNDGVPEYKVMIGSDVYGLQETPFLGDPACDDIFHSCAYQFEAQFAPLHAARNYLVRDLAWDTEGNRGTINFAPAFNSITALPAGSAATKIDSDNDCSLSYTHATKTEPKKKGDAVAGAGPAGPADSNGVTTTITIQPKCTWYEVKGTDFMQIATRADFIASSGNYPRLLAYQDNGLPVPLVLDHWPPVVGAGDAGANLRVVDANTLRVRFSGAPPKPSDGSAPASAPDKSASKTIHLLWRENANTDPIDWPLKVTSSAGTESASLTAKFTADPSVLFVSDSRTVKFTSSSPVGCFTSAQFEGGANLLQTAPPDGAGSSGPSTTSFTLQIPGTITATPGYKEIVVKANKASTSGGKTTCTPTAAKDSVVGILVVGPGVNRQ